MGGPEAASQEVVREGEAAWAAALRRATEELAAEGAHLDHAGVVCSAEPAAAWAWENEAPALAHRQRLLSRRRAEARSREEAEPRADASAAHPTPQLSRVQRKYAASPTPPAAPTGQPPRLLPSLGGLNFLGMGMEIGRRGKSSAQHGPLHGRRSVLGMS